MHALEAQEVVGALLARVIEVGVAEVVASVVFSMVRIGVLQARHEASGESGTCAGCITTCTKIVEANSKRFLSCSNRFSFQKMPRQSASVEIPAVKQPRRGEIEGRRALAMENLNKERQHMTSSGGRAGSR